MTGYNPKLAIMRAAAKARPCPWCYVEAGKPCRANRGKGDELTRFVHPVRMKPAEPSAATETSQA